MTEIIYIQSDAEAANRIQAALSTQQAPLNTDAVILLLSEASLRDATLQQRINLAIDHNKQIIPVALTPLKLPVLIEHLDVVDFSEGDDFPALVEALQTPPSPLHMKVITPAVQASNRRVGAIFGLIATVMFVVGLIMVGVYGVHLPTDEYDAIETQIILTRNYYIDRSMPRSTEDTLNFEATIQAVPSLSPFIRATATALAREAQQQTQDD